MSSPASLVTRAVDAFYWCRLEGVVSRQLFRYAFCGGMNLALDAVWYFVIYHFLIGEGRMIDLGFVYMSAPIASLFLVFPITFFTGFLAQSQRGVPCVAARHAHATAALCVVGRRSDPAQLSMHETVRGGRRYLAYTRETRDLSPFGRIQFSCSTVFHLSRGDRGLSLEKIIHYGMLRRSCLRSSIVIMRISILRRN